MVSRKECEETPNLAIATNVGGTQSVCTLCLKHRARLIYSGSSEEYGTAFKNGAVDESTPFGEPTSIYSMTKRMAEELIQYYSYFKGLNATTMRLFMLYGVGEEPSEYRSAIVRFIDWALKGQPLIVHRGTERSWCYIDDIIEAIKIIVEREQENHYEVFNLGKDDPISTHDLAYKILEVCNSSSTLIITDPEPTVIPIKRASFEKAKQVLGWEAKTPLQEGLNRTTAYIRGL
jgi:nucleoside-diphosphate-sugar epimerase